MLRLAKVANPPLHEGNILTTLKNRPNQALLVIDVQNGVVANAFNRDAVVANIASKVSEARAAGVPVIWVQHSDEELELESPDWQIVDELQPRDGEPRIRKQYKSSFVDTDLEQTLEKLAVSKLYICGAESNHCIRHTSHSAFDRGYDVILIADAHTANSYEWNGHSISAQQVIQEQNDNFAHYEMPGVTAKALPLAEVVFA